MNCQQLNQISLEKVLATLGHFPSKSNEKEAWFLNPFGTETQASFKIDRSRNMWYLFSEGIGGKTLDFIMKFLNCNVKEALHWANEKGFDFSFHQQADNPKATNISITGINPLENLYLKNYLKSRGLSPKVYEYLYEIRFTVNRKKLYAIGFENRSDGWELRNSFYKGAALKKDISIVKSMIPTNTVCVFEGFIDALSYVEIYGETSEDLLVLNSIALIETAKQELKNYQRIKLFLDNDKAGIKTTSSIIFSFPNAENCAMLYRDYKDLNEFLIHGQKT
ncbi:toprim domain-containing protein [Elizabethkingia ursingii]